MRRTGRDIAGGIIPALAGLIALRCVSLVPGEAPTPPPATPTYVYVIEPTSAVTPPARPKNIGQFRLKDRLDDPQGYCIDVPGFGNSIQLDNILQAHTCESGDWDQRFAYLKHYAFGYLVNRIVLVDYDRCVVALKQAIGAGLTTVECDGDSDHLQSFG